MGGDLTPQDAAERHAAHEYHHKGGESTCTDPRGQRHLRGNLQGREDRDPREPRCEHGNRQQGHTVHMREGEGGQRIDRARTRHQHIARELRSHTRQKHGAAHGANADAGQQHPIDFRALTQLAPHDERKQRPRRGSKHKEGAAADEHYLQGAGVHDETHPDANRTEESLRGQRALAMLAPPSQQYHQDADVG